MQTLPALSRLRSSLGGVMLCDLNTQAALRWPSTVASPAVSGSSRARQLLKQRLTRFEPGFKTPRLLDTPSKSKRIAPVQRRRGQPARQVHWLVAPVARIPVLRDLVTAIERTGNYHLPVQRAFEAARVEGRPFDVRVVHPFATKQHRQPAHPGDKTDDNDLAALFRAMVETHTPVAEQRMGLPLPGTALQ